MELEVLDAPNKHSQKKIRTKRFKVLEILTLLSCIYFLYLSLYGKEMDRFIFLPAFLLSTTYVLWFRTQSKKIEHEKIEWSFPLYINIISVGMFLMEIYLSGRSVFILYNLYSGGDFSLFKIHIYVLISILGVIKVCYIVMTRKKAYEYI